MAASQTNVPPRSRRRSTRQAGRLERLREQLAEDPLLGEVLRADDDARRRPCRAPQPSDGEPRRAARAVLIAAAAARCSTTAEQRVRHERRAPRRAARRARIGALSTIATPRKMSVAEPAGADRRGDRGDADADHGRDADARQDDARRERQLDAAAGAAASVMPIPRAASRSAGSIAGDAGRRCSAGSAAARTASARRARSARRCRR